MYATKRKTYVEDMTSAFKSAPLCFDQRPTNVLGGASPLLGLAFHLGSFSFDNNILSGNRILIRNFDITGIRIREGVDVLEGPECRVTNPKSFDIFVRGTSSDRRRLKRRRRGED